MEIWYLQDMELLQYDLLYGKKYAYGDDGTTPFETIDMKMGIHQPEITRVISLPDENKVYVFGSNFTTASKIYINDEWQNTKFISNHVLQVKKAKLTEDALVSVKQLAPGKAKRVLSEGNTMMYVAPVAEEETGETDGTGESTDTEETVETTDTTEATNETGTAPADSEAEGTGTAK